MDVEGPDAGGDLMRAGLDAVEAASWSDGATAFAGAASAFEAAGRPRMAARARIGQANCLSETGDSVRSARLLGALRAALPEDDDLWTAATANLAVCLARGGDLEAADDLWRVAFDRYLAAGEIVDAARCLLDASVSLHERAREVDALRLVGGARSLLARAADAPEFLAAECDATAGAILSALGEPTAARDVLERAAAAFRRLGRPVDEGRCQGNLAVAALRTGDVDGAAEHAAVAGAALAGTGSSSVRAALPSLLAWVALARDDLGEALRLARDGLDRASEADGPLDRADALHNLAVVEAKAGLDVGALAHALDAFDAIERFRYRVASVADRHRLTVTRFEPVVLHALERAGMAGDARTTAVLIERARVAGTPAGDAPPDAVHGPFTGSPVPLLGHDGPLARDLRLPIADPGGLVLDAPHAPGSGRPETSLSALVRAAAGPDAWWWGTWLQRGRLHWAVRSPDGHVESGAAPVPADVLDLARDLAPVPGPQEFEAARALAGGPGPTADRWAQLAATARALGGPMIGDREAAGVVANLLPGSLRARAGRPLPEFVPAMLRLGVAVVPPPLARLAGRARHTPPIRLVVSLAPGLAWLPLPLLAVPDPDGGHRHLVDLATVSLGAPWPVARALAAAKERTATVPPTVVGLGVADPHGDLRHVRLRPVEARRALGSALSPRPATVDAVRAGLSGLGPDEMFVYEGHVELADPGEPATASLVLAGPATDPGGRAHLSAHRILTDPERWSFPHTVPLDGCHSTGAWGSAEWSGLVPALLQRGARQVVSTLWPVVDSGGAAAVTGLLVRALLERGDAAAAVADVQRGLLSGWRRGRSTVTPHHLGAHVATGTFAGA